MLSAGLHGETQWVTFEQLAFPGKPTGPITEARNSKHGRGAAARGPEMGDELRTASFVIDSVNEAPIMITDHGLKPSVLQGPILSTGEPPMTILDQVWAHVSEWAVFQGGKG